MILLGTKIDLDSINKLNLIYPQYEIEKTDFTNLFCYWNCFFNGVEWIRKNLNALIIGKYVYANKTYGNIIYVVYKKFNSSKEIKDMRPIINDGKKLAKEIYPSNFDWESYFANNI